MHIQYIACFCHCIEYILAIKAKKKIFIDLHIQDTVHMKLTKGVLPSGNVDS